jgi:hypothetical protein
MPKRKRIRPKLLKETQEFINQIRPDVFARYEGVNDTSLNSFVAGWLSWVLNKKYKRPDGTQYNAVSPHTREQIKCWIKEGKPYKWDGGLDADAEAEHERADAAQRKRVRRRHTAPPLQKKRRRRQRTTA